MNLGRYLGSPKQMPRCYMVKKTDGNGTGADSPLWEANAPSPEPSMYTYVQNTLSTHLETDNAQPGTYNARLESDDGRPETENVLIETEYVEMVIEETTEIYETRPGNYDIQHELYDTDSSSQSPRYACHSFTRCETSDTQPGDSIQSHVYVQDSFIQCDGSSAQSVINAQYMYAQCSNADSQSDMYNAQPSNCNAPSNTCVQPETHYIRPDNYETQPERYYLQPENFDTHSNYNTQYDNCTTPPDEYVQSNNNNMQPDALTDNYGTRTDNNSTQTDNNGTQTNTYGTQTDNNGTQTNSYGTQTVNYYTQTDNYNSHSHSFISQSQTYLQPGKFIGSPTINFRQDTIETNIWPGHTPADTEGAHDLLSLSQSLPLLTTPQPLVVLNGGIAQPLLIPTPVCDHGLMLENEIQNTDTREQFVGPMVMTREPEFINQGNPFTLVTRDTDYINQRNVATFINPDGDILTQQNVANIVTQNADFFNQEDVATLMAQEPEYMNQCTGNSMRHEPAVTPQNIMHTSTMVPSQFVVLTDDRPADVYGSANLVRPRENHMRLADVNSVRLTDVNAVRLADVNSVRLADVNSVRLADVNSVRPGELNFVRPVEEKATESSVVGSMLKDLFVAVEAELGALPSTRRAKVVRRARRKKKSEDCKKVVGASTTKDLQPAYLYISYEKACNRFACPLCNRRYSSPSNLSRHQQTHRDSKHAKECHICAKKYVSMAALAMHVQTHEPPVKCEVCNRTFARQWLLRCHMRAHTGEKPYGCAHCGNTFANRSKLRKHMTVHLSVDKCHECVICKSGFLIKSSCLARHADTSTREEGKSEKDMESGGMDKCADGEGAASEQ